MNCSICRAPILKGDRIAYNHRETFVFKPAHVEDVPMTRKVGDKEIPVPASAVLSQDELLESRKEHTRTEVATSYVIFGDKDIPAGAFAMRHSDCLQRTGDAGGFHAANKHSVRWRNVQAGRKMH